MANATQTDIEKKLHATLAVLGGQVVGEDSIRHEGSEFILPLNMTKAQGLNALVQAIKSEDEVTAFSHTFNYRPWDGAYGFVSAVKKHFGFIQGVTERSMWGDTPPRLIDIPIGHGEHARIPWGKMAIPTFPGVSFTTGQAENAYGPVFTISAEAPNKYKAEIEGLFKLVEAELQEHSIYKGKAVDGADMPDFLDLSKVDLDSIVYSENLRAQLETNVWAMLRHREALATYGISAKRAVVFSGPHGNGKTLTAHATAKIAVENGVTFIYCRPGQNRAQVMLTAQLYQPSVVFFEDMDVMADQARDSQDLSQLLELLDGLGNKECNILSVFTTNYPENIQKGMLRPGRVDAVIPFGELDRPGVEQMVRVNLPTEMIAEVDFDQVYASVEGFQPAFVKEVIGRAKLYSISNNHGVLGAFTTKDLVDAANGLRPQLDMMQDAKEGTHVPTLDEALRSTIQEGLVEWDNNR